MSSFDDQVSRAAEWVARDRFRGIQRLFTPRQIAEQQGTVDNDYPVARDAAEGFFERLRELFAEKKSITTFGPYSPGQAVSMKRLGIEGIYLGGWATSAKGSKSEDPGADLASYPLSAVPEEAAPLVRGLLAADRNQHFARSRMSQAQRDATPIVDYRPFIIADADTGHGGDAHVRNLVRRFAEVGVPGYHIEDQKPGLKKCGHQGGKVLVPVDEQIKRPQRRPLPARHHEGGGHHRRPHRRRGGDAPRRLRGDERDQPFVLGATNLEAPERTRSCTLAHASRRIHEARRRSRAERPPPLRGSPRTSTAYEATAWASMKTDTLALSTEEWPPTRWRPSRPRTT